MKSLSLLAALLLLLSSVVVAVAQAAPEEPSPVPNPVTTTDRQQLERSAKNLVAAAESMPAEKYSFRPTPEQMDFALLVVHTAEANTFYCSRATGKPEPEGAKPAETDPKEKLVAALKASFEFCSTVLAGADDSHLGEIVTLFGGRKAPRAAAFISLSNGWADHYAAAAMYLRLNGVLPPTAKPRSAQPATGAKSPDSAAINQIYEEDIAAHRAGDPDRAPAIYTEDVVWLPPSGPAISGRAAVRERYRSAFASYTVEFSVHSEETIISQDWAYDLGTTQGTMTPKDGGEPRPLQDKYIAIFQRVPGAGWRIARLMWNPI
ncbi:MAG: SgcJ/EcaC family oxidoreductase [Terriglobales bacterium]